MTFRLWTLNRALRWLGVTVAIKLPGSADVPTLIRVKWIGWGPLRRAADDTRGAASGHARDRLREIRYMRCVAASDAAFDEAVAREYS